MDRDWVGEGLPPGLLGRRNSGRPLLRPNPRGWGWEWELGLEE